MPNRKKKIFFLHNLNENLFFLLLIKSCFPVFSLFQNNFFQWNQYFINPVIIIFFKYKWRENYNQNISKSIFLNTIIKDIHGFFRKKSIKALKKSTPYQLDNKSEWWWISTSFYAIIFYSPSVWKNVIKPVNSPLTSDNINEDIQNKTI